MSCLFATLKLAKNLPKTASFIKFNEHFQQNLPKTASFETLQFSASDWIAYGNEYRFLVMHNLIRLFPDKDFRIEALTVTRQNFEVHKKTPCIYIFWLLS